MDDLERAYALVPGRFSDRFVAYLVDTVPFSVGAVASVWIWGGPMQRVLDERSLYAIGLIWTALAVLWQFVGNLYGATVGKSLMGLRVVVAADGTGLGPGRAIWRALTWLVLSTPAANFGFWFALFHHRTRTLHDLASGTCVVESGPRRSNGALAFTVGALSAIGLFTLNYWMSLLRPTPRDIDAVVRAEQGLGVVAQIQEAYKARHGVYAATVQDLAQASGDIDVFRQGMLKVFMPSPFILEAGNRRWQVTAAAKDRRHTRVRTSGP